MPTWVAEAFCEYKKRFPRELSINLCEIELPKRSSASDTNRMIQKESQLILAKIPKHSLIIALDEHGKEWGSVELAKKLETWQLEYQDVSFLVGGPDGLAKECLAKAQHIWSLSKLTLPHQLVRVIFIEQMYRAWTILCKHPYHRN